MTSQEYEVAVAAVPKEMDESDIGEKTRNRCVDWNNGELRICLSNPTMLSVNRRLEYMM